MRITRPKAGLLLGLFFFVLILILPVAETVRPEAVRVLAVAALMACWWISEAIPIPATALLPIVMFPALDIMAAADATRPYANHLIYLFLGGFLIAIAIEKWHLHRRIALHTIRLVGLTRNRIILGFMLATAGLSMWISNTAATMMMVTIGMAVISQIGAAIDADPGLDIDTRPGRFRFATALMLGIAYAASIGGVATLIGTPPNAILAGVVETTFGQRVGFFDWMLFALPLSAVMLLITWYYLTQLAYPSEITDIPGGHRLIREQLQALGPMSREEKWVLAVFATVACLWVVRGLVDSERFELVQDSTIAIGGALVLFVIPSNWRQGEFLLDWHSASRIPWDILILFGGGFALAQGFNDSGLTRVIAEQLRHLSGSDIFVVIAVVTLVVIVLTEITSNTATASLLLPVMGALAVAMEKHPYGLMVAVAISASFAFMLPVATPPNAIAFSSRHITIQQMAKTGIWVNLIALVLITLFIYLVLPAVWNIDLDVLPDGFSAPVVKSNAQDLQPGSLMHVNVVADPTGYR